MSASEDLQYSHVRIKADAPLLRNRLNFRHVLNEEGAPESCVIFPELLPFSDVQSVVENDLTLASMNTSKLTSCGLPFFQGCGRTRMFPGCGSQWMKPHENVIAPFRAMARSMTSLRLRPHASSCFLSVSLLVSYMNGDASLPATVNPFHDQNAIALRVSFLPAIHLGDVDVIL